MNLDEIKKRLDKLNNKGGGGSTNDFKNNFWRPPVGEKSVIRIVPSNTIKTFRSRNYTFTLVLVNQE